MSHLSPFVNSVRVSPQSVCYLSLCRLLDCVAPQSVCYLSLCRLLDCVAPQSFCQFSACLTSVRLLPQSVSPFRLCRTSVLLSIQCVSHLSPFVNSVRVIGDTYLVSPFSRPYSGTFECGVIFSCRKQLWSPV